MLHVRPLYVAAGDSLTVGIGSTFFQPNFVKWYHHDLESFYRLPVDRQVFAKNGATTDDILSILARPDAAAAIKNAQVITLTGGGNDFLRAGRLWLRTGNAEPVNQAMKSSIAHFEEMVRFIYRLHDNDSSSFMVRILNLYNPLFYIPHTNAWLEQYNERLQSLEKIPSVRVADIFHVFAGREPQLLGFDRIHPNPIGYRLMAEATSALGFKQFY
ncbi:GDSL-type esterase/lipase family protein [Sporolactobacillus sp. CPB3-1]|uniref:GDSL-type esterase/lipase family protein n=1 Tax=Sporolactobacillus mangiferae TaxID=2940498 RepID=A0ABT0M8D2_9BACL|nr:GDSL-type esterase/lipase family protein [Sporolactobacillus mangiferae]MCL1631131.1 GDSL-type esterase/lipase family protein [Sporolactobacillus mangiferae]